jgi:protoporphyrinogen oxidase
MVSDPQKYMWIGLEYFCSEGDEMWNMEDKDFIEFAISELEKIDVLEPGVVKDSVRIKVKKAYPAYFGAYTEFDKVRNYLDGIENLWCIGRNGQHRYNNMDHSMLTAVEAVRAIKEGSTDKKNVWNVNTEKEYHEEKKAN